MSVIIKGPEEEQNAVESALLKPSGVASPGKRKLIKLGTAAVPVVLTLTSRPVLAWHCQSPSAWGSLQINPNSSLKANAGHNALADESWTVTNWLNNTHGPSALTTNPWDILLGQNSALKTACGNNSNNVTIAMLIANVSGFTTTAASGSKLRGATGVLTTGSELQKRTIVAQLNYITLASGAGWDLCLRTPSESGAVIPLALKQMALGTYIPTAGGSPWTATQTNSYLDANFIAQL